MRGQSMFYKIRNILWLAAMAFGLAANTAGNVRAQGVITLSEEAANDDALNQDIPDEISLFADDGGSSSGADELGGIKPEKPADSNPAAAEPQMEGPQPPLPAAVNMPNTTAAPAAAVPAALPVQAPATPQAPAANTGTPIMADKLMSTPGAGVGILGTNEERPIDDEIFSQMSDIEKQTALLNLELRREKIRNEIEAIKNQRKQAVVEEQEKKEAQRREKLEWEKEQEQKVLQEQQKLRELDIQFENARQEKLLNAYKNQMLAENQKWIDHNAGLYKQIEDVKKEKQAIYDDTKKKFEEITTSARNAALTVKEVRAAHKKEVEDLQTQISILKARIEAQEQEMARQNPFAEGEAEQQPQVTADKDSVTLADMKLANMYAVMEIRGQGGELIAKLINQDGMPFYVKKGTTLQSGHQVDEITSTYVRAERNGLKDYLYFAAGGILPLEQPASTLLPKDFGGSGGTAEAEEENEPAREFVSSPGVPGLGKSMIVR